MSQSIEDLIGLAEETEDQSVVTAGGDFVYELPVEGLTVGRLIEYVELGKRPQKPWQGKSKPPVDMVRLTFELLSPAKNIKEIEVNGEKRTVAEYITITIAKKQGEKARFKKLFNKLVYGRPIKHLARCLGNAYTITIVHNTVAAKDGHPEKKYANIEKDGEWLIGAPFAVDAITGTKTEYPVPGNMHPLKIFLWDNPTKETWDSLFIDGTRDVKNDKGEVIGQESKNWLQESILSAVDFPGSKLQLLLGGVAGSDLPMEEPKAESSPLPDNGPLAGGGVVTDPAASTAAGGSQDALAALGLG
jgi:hypothetical protein